MASVSRKDGIMLELIEKMNEYWETHEAPYEEDGFNFFEEGDTDYYEIQNLLWDSLFIDSEFNPETKELLKENGFTVRATDRDSFGILVAVIGKDDKYMSIG